MGANPVPTEISVLRLFQHPELTPGREITSFGAACAVHPLIGGGVAEWLKAAVC
jgi:hypothetical protein